MFKKHHKRSSNPLFVIFRLILSLAMFTLLLGGIYTAYKHFSGLDPLKFDPQSVLKNVLASKNPQQFAAALSFLKLDSLKPGNKVIPADNRVLGKSAPQIPPLAGQTNSANYLFRFMLFADSHSDNQNLKKAIVQAKSSYPDISFIIGLGDYTDVGTVTELKNAKVELDSANLRYFVIAGDHDLWDSRDKGKVPSANFKQVFGPLYQSFNYNNFKFLLLDNSDNYLGLGSEQPGWISEQLEKAKSEASAGIFAFIHAPLFHPSSDHYMGRVEKQLKTQAEGLIFQLKTAGVNKIFSGDIHYFSEYEEPVTKLSMATVGALVTDRNPQAPRYAIVSVFADGSSKVEDVELK